MALYDEYKHLLGRPYVSGSQDCYGLVRDYYHDVFAVNIINFARPELWWEDPEMDLINRSMHADGWEQVSTSSRGLKKGDGLIFSLITGRANHVGVYVGNGMFIHHIYRAYSSEEAYTPKWANRLLSVVRHSEVTAVLESMVPKTDILSLMPEHAKRRIAGQT